MLARWAAYFDDPELALMALRSLPADDFSDAIAYTLWDKLMRDVRKLPGFKDLVRDMGLVDYWRETGKWSDFCHPISSSNGDNDFECE